MQTSVTAGHDSMKLFSYQKYYSLCRFNYVDACHSITKSHQDSIMSSCHSITISHQDSIMSSCHSITISHQDSILSQILSLQPIFIDRLTSECSPRYDN